MSDDHTHVQEFFSARAAHWDTRFPDDGPRFEAAVAELGLRTGDRVLDAGCGTGRALAGAQGRRGAFGGRTRRRPDARDAGGRRAGGTGSRLPLMLADVTRLPVRSQSLDAVFGSGLVAHLPRPQENLRELARVVRPGGLLALFHPIGRAALAARQSRELTPDDLRAEPNLRSLLAGSGWRMTSYVDEDARFLALAERRG